MSAPKKKAASKAKGKPATKAQKPHQTVITLRPRKTTKSASAYAGAAVNRLTEDWPMMILSADGATRWSLRQLRARSRDLERNGAVLTRYLAALEANVIGSTGVGLQMKIRERSDRFVTDPEERIFLKALQAKANADVAERRARLVRAGYSMAVAAEALKAPVLFEVKGEMIQVQAGEPDRYANAIIEAAWKEDGQHGQWDVTGKHSRNDFWRLALRTGARDGDAIILVYRGFNNKAGLGWQLQEGDYLDDYFNTDLPNGNTVRMSVELDRMRRKVAYWVLAKHPGDYGVEGSYYDGKRLRIPALGFEPESSVHIIHVSRSLRAEETRAVPWVTPAMTAINMLEGYEEAELTAARVEACKHVFYEREAFSADGELLPWTESGNGELTDEMEPGCATDLPPGYKANVYDPKHPNTAYPEYVKSVKRKISSALNCAYNTLFVDLESVNYSSIRAGLLDERESWKMCQSWLRDDVCTPSFEHWLEWKLLTGQLPFGMADFDRLNAPEFKFKRWPWVDPKNDAETAKLMIDMKITTRSRVIADMSGNDFEETVDELDYEAAYIAEKVNLRLADQTAAALAAPPPAKPEEVVKPAEEEEEPEDPKPAPPVKSAFLGDVALADLPEETEATIRQFVPGTHEQCRVARYGMTVPELIDKADQRNLETARNHVRRGNRTEAAAAVRERPDKCVLLLNDRVIDGHHHLAKAEHGKITSSLPVLDLTPLRYQQPPAQASQSVEDQIKALREYIRDNLGQFAPDTGGGGGGGGGGGKISWIDKAPGLPEETKAHHTGADGGYTPERRELHQSIVDKFFGDTEAVPSDQTPVAILMMGGPASGKSTFVKNVDTSKFVHVDADAIKRELPEFKAAYAQHARNAASMAHEESSDLAKEIGQKAIATKRNLLFDGTGANKEKYAKLIGDLKGKGYHVKLIASHIPVEVALQRAAGRDRHVPEKFIRETYAKIPASYAHNSALADEAKLWDNSGEEPRLAAEKRADGTVAVHHPDFLTQHGFQ